MTRSLNRIVDNTLSKLRESIHKWHSYSRHLQLTSKLKGEKKKMVIEVLQRMMDEKEK